MVSAADRIPMEAPMPPVAATLVELRHADVECVPAETDLVEWYFERG